MNIKPCFFGQGKCSLNLLPFGMFKYGAQPPAVKVWPKTEKGALEVVYLQI